MSDLRNFFEGRLGCDLSKLSEEEFVLLVKQHCIKADETSERLRLSLLERDAQVKGLRAFKATMRKAMVDLEAISEPSSVGKIAKGLREGSAEKPVEGETEYAAVTPWPEGTDFRDVRQIQIAEERARKVAV